MKRHPLSPAALGGALLSAVAALAPLHAETFVGQTVALDGEGKLIPWYAPANRAYHEFLVRRWNFVKNAPASPASTSPNDPVERSTFPQYYFYNGYVTQDTSRVAPDGWMNDVGEKVPNWFENARLYYAYTGDLSVMTIAKGLVDHSLAYGTTPADFAWPKFPYTTTNVGDVVYRGFTTAGRFVLHEVHLDHGGDMGLTYFRMWQFYGEQKYLDAAIAVADALAANVRTGDREKSVWPYRVNAETGAITSEYGANWIGCYALLDELVKGGHGSSVKIAAYTNARDKARAWMLAHPVVTGYWTDGHSDTQINSSTYRSNLSKSNYALYMLDHPDFDPDRATNFPKYVQWTEDYFVNRTDGGEPATFYGANVVGEQDTFNWKMDYQTARYAAELARWYAITGDATYREKACRSLNFVTYCSDLDGRATESPFSLGIATWWSDCYGEGPRMFFHAFAGVPEWAEPGVNHILYSYEILTDVDYSDPFHVAYTVGAPSGTEYLRLTYVPTSVTVAGVEIPQVTALGDSAGWTVRALEGGDYAVTLRRTAPGRVVLLTTNGNYGPTVALTSPAAGAALAPPAALLLTAAAADPDGTVAKVEFYNGDTKLGEDATAPYSLPLAGLPAGTYSFAAVATDNEGLRVTSAPVRFTVAATSEVTLGNTAEGTTTDYITDNSGAYIHGNRFEASASFSATGLRARLQAISGTVRMALYADSNGSPGALLGQATPRTSIPAGWADFTLATPVAISSGRAYWITIWSDTDQARVYAVNGGTVRFAAYLWSGGWPATLSFNGGNTLTFCLYAYGTVTQNAAPSVSAGPAQSVTLPATASLAGSASDADGPSSLSVNWTLVSGPGPVTFANAAATATTAGFTAAGSYVLRLAASDGAVSSASDVSVTVAAAVASGFAAWAESYSLTGDNAAATADPDADGANNLLEYALALDPFDPDAEALPTGILNPAGDKLTLSFRRARAELTYLVQGSTDLASWSDLATYGPSDIATVGQSVTFTDTLTLGSSNSRRFLRLKVTAP